MKLLSELLVQFNYPFMCLMNSNGYKHGFSDKIVFGRESVKLNDFGNGCYGILNYDLKDSFFSNIGGEISSSFVAVPDEVMFRSSGEFLDFKNDLNGNDVSLDLNGQIEFQPAVSKQEYIETVHKIKNDIHNGSVYELNYCVPFYAENVCLDPIKLYQKLNYISPVPFSSLLKLNDHWVICASPERFLKKEGDRLVTEPIKGTIARDFKDDAHQKEVLANSEKERAENLMIVDLVRHDLNQV